MRTVSVELSKYAVRGRKIVTEPDPAWRGLRVEYPTAVVDEEGHLRGGASVADDAVIVVEVAEGSPAAAAGLRRGMLITHVDRLPVRTPKEFAAGRRPQSRPRSASPGRRREEPDSHGRAGDVASRLADSPPNDIWPPDGDGGSRRENAFRSAEFCSRQLPPSPLPGEPLKYRRSLRRAIRRAGARPSIRTR